MPSNVNASLPGAIVSLLAYLRNQGRPNAASAPQAPAAASGQAAPAPQVPPPAPDSRDNAVRFDFSEAPVPTAQTAPAAPAAPVMAALPPADVPPAALAPSAADRAPAARDNVMPAATAAGTGTAVSRAGGQAGDAAPLSRTAQLPEPADPDDEAMARAWALRTLARENTLSMIDRIARMAEAPEAKEASDGRAAQAPQPAEPKTLARA